ncbi:hypothetical protein THASP1DRAFT_30209 [Thamnocephalis sphaerospora]|uniref:Uncharacterized protein n=1 Tax=Thamnocephalis sphaerospora TaxID=78915 RepID=A0A4V1IWL6_9FUNG|nr:hypothetical protein THASP1DRAFT_30209 [Thamnocephalis sphaerospora]|eukprot:RKP07989.1 hypothetical protein THASP1DRAFT_30209 [Thamnocephalis sphaerospora]
MWAHGCLKDRTGVEATWHAVPESLSTHHSVQAAYLCAQLWCGDSDAVESSIKQQLAQAAEASAVDSTVAMATRQVLRALLWELADSGDLDRVQRAEVLRQQWVQLYESKHTWGPTEPLLVMMHAHYARLNMLRGQPQVTAEALCQAADEFRLLLEDTRRNANFSRGIEFYNIFIRCNTAINQLSERLGLSLSTRNADEIIEDMQSDGVTPNRFTYHLLLENIVYSRMPFPDNFDHAFRIANMMERSGEERRVSKTYELLLRAFPLSRLAYQSSKRRADRPGQTALPTHEGALRRLMDVERMMLDVDSFAHTTATICAFWYRLAALGQFREVRRRWEQLSDAGVQLTALHYETYTRVASRNRAASAHALNVVFHQMARETPPIALDHRLLLGFLNCCASVNDPYTAMLLLEQAAGQSTTETKDDAAAVRDWNNCLRPLTALCARSNSAAMREPAGVATLATVTACRNPASARAGTAQLVQRVRELARHIVLPRISVEASPYPAVRYYINAEEDLATARSTLEQHVRLHESMADSKQTGAKTGASSNPAYFVQVARSYTDLTRAYLAQNELEGAHAMLAGLAQHYIRHVANIRGHLDGRRYGRELVVPEWTLLAEFAQRAVALNQPEGNAHARWALDEAAPLFARAEQQARQSGIGASQRAFAGSASDILSSQTWMDKVERTLAERSMTTPE